MLKTLKSRRIIIALVIALIVASSAALGVFAFVREFTPDFRTIIDERCARYAVDNYLVYALIKAESGYNPEAVSRKGAVGLMQIMPATAAWITGESVTAEDLTDPRVNIDIGVMLLARLSRKYTDIRQVLAAYNAGSARVDEWIEKGEDFDNLPYEETKNYLKKVKAFKSVYEFVLKK